MNFRLQLKEGWSTLFLSLGMVLITAFAIFQAELAEGLESLIYIGGIGYVVGFFLAQSVFSPRVSVGLSAVYALFSIVFVLGIYLYPEETLWIERATDLFQRQGAWLQKAFNEQTSRDQAIFVIQTSILFWVLGHTAAWFTFRDPKIWRVVVPSGLILLSVVFYYYGPRPLSLYLAIYIIFAFLYVARTYLASEQSEWNSAVVRYERTIVYNFMLAGLMVSIASMLVAFTAPTPGASTSLNNALGGANTPLRRFQDNWTRLFASLRTYGTDTSDNFSDSLTLGGPRDVGDTLVMDVFVENQLPYAYWYAVTFDTYEDGEWSITPGDREVHVPDDGLISVPATGARKTITQTVRTYLPSSGNIYGMSEVVTSDRQMFVTAQRDSQGKKLVSLVQSRYVLPQGTVYNVQSQFSTANGRQLRESGTRYPTWLDVYFQVPDTITPRTIELAADLTAGLDNNFDKAIAVRDFLRDHITYNDQIDAPPDGAEPIDYVLFEDPEGYCNYYASAMVMMLRSQGVPARVVSGYAAGEFVSDANLYRVRAKDAHTWVEVYFPNYGWIPFEPTASISPYNRPDGDVTDLENDVPSPLDEFETPLEDREEFLPEENFEDPGAAAIDDLPVQETGTWGSVLTLQSLRRMGAVLVVLLSGVALYLTSILNSRVETDVVQSYDRLGRWGEWLGLALSPTQTPYERAEHLVESVPDGELPIRQLTDKFVVHSYSNDDTTESNPQEEWRMLRPIMLRQSVRHYVGGFFLNLRGRWRRWRY